MKESMMIVGAQVNCLSYPMGSVHGFVTGANDGKLAFYDLNGKVQFFCETPPNVMMVVIDDDDGW